MTRSLIYVFKDYDMFRRFILCKIFERIDSLNNVKDFDANTIECLANYVTIIGVIFRNKFNFTMETIRPTRDRVCEDNEKFRKILIGLQSHKDIPSYLQSLIVKCIHYI